MVSSTSPVQSLRAPKRHSAGFASRLNVTADALLIAMAVFAASAPFGRLLEAGEQGWVAATLIFTWIVTAAALRHYASLAYERNVLDDAAMVGTQTLAVVTVLAFIELFSPASAPLPRISIFLAILLPSALLLRVALFRRMAGREEPIQSLLIVGIGPLGRYTALDRLANGHCRIAGHLRYANQGEKDLEALQKAYAAAGLPASMLGPTTDLESVLRTVVVDEVYVAGRAAKHANEMQACLRICERFGVPFAIPAYDFRLERAHLDDSHDVRDGYLHCRMTNGKGYQRGLKRLLDVVASGAAVWLLLPLFAIVAFAIVVTSRGPVFFKQVRVGRHGRPFTFLKFRSMVVNAESLRAALARSNEQTGPVFKMKHDPRVTAVGRFIRKHSIDELPQLINVLRGDMSLVGPRPPLPSEVEKYEAWQRRRLSVRPGLTCLWQVSGRNQVSFEDWMYLDMQYIDHWSLKMDLDLIFRTVPAVLTGRGAS